MTKFEELMDVISRKKNSSLKGSDTRTLNTEEENDSLEVAGSESSKRPLISCAGDQTDPDLLDQLHRSIKTKPNDGSGASSWDSDY